MFRKPSDRPSAQTSETVVSRPPGPFSRLLVPASVVDLTVRGLRGYAPSEGLCYWFGQEFQPRVGIVMAAAFPRIYSTERSFQLAEGQLGELSRWSQQRGLWLLAQVHTHPADEPHSEADEEWAPTRREGFLSIVIPFSAQFARVHRPAWRCYVCNAKGSWVHCDERTVEVFEDVWLPGGSE